MSKNLLYISCHSVLEADELALFTELGWDCFSLGAYHNLGHDDLPRPKIPDLKYHDDLDKIYIANPNRSKLHPTLIEWADVIIFMHTPDLIVQNWSQIRHKRVIWRSIGQSTPGIESKLASAFADGLQIVRYSPKEQNIPGFIGQDAVIRFYKDPKEYTGWNGLTNEVVSFSQSLKGRRDFCHYDEIIEVIKEFNGKVYGPGNEDLGGYNGGQLPYDLQLKTMREAVAMPYGGTWPAAYTLVFIEAMMMGLPIVAISKRLAHIPRFENIDFYEVDEILSKISGIVCDSPRQMIKETARLRNDPQHAMNISERQRKLALSMFGRDKIAKQWKEFLNAGTK